MPIPVGEGELLRDGSDLLIVGFGPIVMRALSAADLLVGEGWSPAVINARFAKPLDRDLILTHARGKSLVVTIEESVVTGGFGSGVLEVLAEASQGDAALRAVPVRIIGLAAEEFVDHGSVADLRRLVGLDVDGIARQIREALATVGARPTATPQPRLAEVTPG
jgi:1-deoxy-D-xylulose-5-phosphate synthase